MKYLVFDGGSSRHSGFFPQPFSRVPGAGAGSGGTAAAFGGNASDIIGLWGISRRNREIFDDV